MDRLKGSRLAPGSTEIFLPGEKEYRAQEERQRDGVPLPERHVGQPLDDTSMENLSRLYVTYLQRMFDSFAPVAFAVQDRLIEAENR